MKQFEKKWLQHVQSWTQTEYQNKHYNIEQKDEGTSVDRGRDGGKNFISRIKEQETRLTVHEHDDDDNNDDDWRKFSFCTAPNSQGFLIKSRASLSWQCSVQLQENCIRQLPSRPVSSQILGTGMKVGNNCIYISDHTGWKTWTMRN
jgi:hypothetical protein